MSRISMMGWASSLVGGEAEWSSGTGGGLVREDTIIFPGELHSAKVSGLASGTQKGLEILNSSVLVADGDHAYWSIRFYVVTRPSAANRIVMFGSGTTFATNAEIKLSLASTGEVSLIETGAGTIATTAVLSLNTWYTLGVRVKRDLTVPNTTLDQLELQLDGVQVGQNNAVAISAATSRFAVGGNLAAEAQTQGEWYFGSIRHNTSAGSVEVTWPSLRGVLTYLKPNGIGTFDEPTPTGAATNWQCTNELTPDNATTNALMITSSASFSAAGSRLLMDCEAASVGNIGASDTVTLVSVGAVVSGVTATSCSMQPGLRSGTTNSTVGTARVITQTTDCFLGTATTTKNYTPLYTDPDTAAAWTVSALNTAQVGGFAPDATPDVQLTTAWLIVEYVPATDTLMGQACL